MAEVLLPRFDALDGTGRVLHRGVPVRRVAGRLVTTVFDLMLAQYGVRRDGLPGVWPGGFDDPVEPYTPAWQEPITSVPIREMKKRGGGSIAQTASLFWKFIASFNRCLLLECTGCAICSSMPRHHKQFSSLSTPVIL
ncbi:hypothetical protein [Acidovorax sp. BLS4]|uniref:hypothetical protein n=1 Tax=Acidovorax sp. BLS4 TaxID=3273430 RepID=UPI002941DB19|nr:hypothetical protein [Paracidovorax avenae]WOI45586.1 hypothetical protein R1Z03_24530 [Paracidovorax avenae]